jgi:MscS family membrane protein
MSRNRLLRVGLIVSILAATASQAAASTAAAATSAIINLSSPQATFITFRDAAANKQAATAIACLDFTGIREPLTEDQKFQLAQRLHAICERLGPFEPATLPNNAGDARPFAFSAILDPRSAIQFAADAQQIVIARSRDGLFRFTSQSIAAIPKLHEKLFPTKSVLAATPAAGADSAAEFAARLKALFPPVLQRAPFLLPNYQWLALAIVVVLGWVVDRMVRMAVRYLTAASFRFLRTDDENQTRRELGRPVGWLAAAVVWHGGVSVIGLPPQVAGILLIAVKFFAIIAAVVAIFRLIDVLTGYISARAATTSTRFDDLLVPLVSKSLKSATICLGGLMGAQAFELPIAGLLGGLGLGGAALALASKDAVSNMIGSLNLLADRPFEIGDWVIVEGVEGTIEQVGFRSTRIRTFYNSLVTLPNSRLTTAILDNMGRRRYRRLKTSLSLSFDSHTPRVEAFCEGIRELIRRHPYTRKDYFLVYLNQIAEKSLEVQVDCFFECPDLPTELRERHRLMLDILALGDRLRIRFSAAPQTHHHGPADDAQEKLVADDPIGAGQQVAAQIAAAQSMSQRREMRVIGATHHRAAA